MTGKNNFDMPTGSEHPARDALDDIDETVARITDTDIEDRLHETLHLAGYSPRQHAAPSRTSA